MSAGFVRCRYCGGAGGSLIVDGDECRDVRVCVERVLAYGPRPFDPELHAAVRELRRLRLQWEGRDLSASRAAGREVRP